MLRIWTIASAASSRSAFRHQHAPPDHRADSQQPGFQLQSRSFFRCCPGIRHATRLQETLHNASCLTPEILVVPDKGVQPGELVGHQVVERDSATGREILRVRTCVNDRGWRGKAYAIGGGDISGSPVPYNRQFAVCGNDSGIGRCNRVCPNEVLAGPGEPVPSKRVEAGPHNWFESDVAGLGEEHGAKAGPEAADTVSFARSIAAPDSLSVRRHHGRSGRG